MHVRWGRDEADVVAARELLLHREVAHSFLLRAIEQTDAASRVGLAIGDDEIVGVLVWSSTRTLIWSEIERVHATAAVAAGVVALGNECASIARTYGPEPVASAFAGEIAARSGRSAVVEMRYHHFELERVIAPPSPDGKYRAATMDDVKTLSHYYDGFVTDARLPEEERARAHPERVAERVRAGEFRVWEVDGRVVCVAAMGGTARVRRIGIVYTPPELRKQGFASALVAHASDELLRGGAWRVSLSTDPTNETSNHIYQAIGFRRVAEAVLYRFV